MKHLSVLLLALSFSSPLYAEGNKAMGFWEALRMKIEQLTPQKKLGTTTAVGGVRGAPVEESDVYWKGEAKPQPIDSEELADFRNAMALVEAGKKPEASTAFADFAKKYPGSPLRKDADEALAQLQTK